MAVYGHSSSAAINWMSLETSYFSGGIYHAATIYGVKLKNPKPIPWREKAPTPKYQDFMENMLYHSEWSEKVGSVKADVAVIALGANDSKSISDSHGKPRSAYQMRQKAILDMLDLVAKNQMKCMWIGPPDSEMKIPAREDTLYQYLEEAVVSQCDFFNSRHYKAIKWLPACDGVHFSCNAQSAQLADKWAKEVSEFINQNLN